MKMNEEQKISAIEALEKMKKLVEEDKVTAIASAVLLKNETKTFLMGSAVKLYGLVGMLNQDIVKESIKHDEFTNMLGMIAWEVKRIDKQCLALLYNGFLDFLISDFNNPNKTKIIPADGSKFFHLKSLKAVEERISLTAEFVEYYAD